MRPILVPTPDLEHDAHRVFRNYRPITPFIRRDDGVFLAIRAADVERLATDPRTRQMETELGLSRGVIEVPLFDFYKNTMLLSNGPEHRKRRAPLARAFASRGINDLRPHVRDIVNALIDEHSARGEMSFRDQFAALVPARVIADVLGIPADDIPEFTRNVYQLARALSSSLTREDVPEMQAAAQRLTRYVEGLLNERRASPREDLLTSYVNAVEEEEALSRLEILIQIVTVILAGSDTTRAAMTIQISLLLQNRVQWEALCRDSSLIPGAVLESLRYEPSVGSFPRFTLEDVEIDGWTVPCNSVLSMSTHVRHARPGAVSRPGSIRHYPSGSSATTDGLRRRLASLPGRSVGAHGARGGTGGPERATPTTRARRYRTSGGRDGRYPPGGGNAGALLNCHERKRKAHAHKAK